jgi:hypothetical protein
MTSQKTTFFTGHKCLFQSLPRYIVCAKEISGRCGGPEFDSRRYHIFCVAMGVERGRLGLVRINEELLERKVTAPV